MNDELNTLIAEARQQRAQAVKQLLVSLVQRIGSATTRLARKIDAAFSGQRIGNAVLPRG